MNIGREILTTRGITSVVNNMHIGLFDFDNGIRKSKVMQAVKDLDGINILWRSSNTGYHVWNLSVRSREEIALLGLCVGSDCKHVASGFRRDKWVLRISPKWQNDEIYKAAPELLNVWHNPTLEYAQSLPHLRVYEAITGKRISKKEDYVFDGEGLNVEAYRTYTDKMKGVLNLD